MTLPRFAVAALLVLSVAGPVAAQSVAPPVTVQFENGKVTLIARNAPVRAVLAEWARVGGSKIVNAERVAGAPVTLELTNVTESNALSVLLRNVSGYIVAARPATSTGASAFDRILILPTSTATATRAPTASAPFAVAPPMPQFVPGDPDDDVDVISPDGTVRATVRTTQTPQQLRDTQLQLQQQLRDVANRASTARGTDADEEEPQRGQQAAPARTPGLPAGGTVVGSSRPGVITPVPQQPRNPARPADSEP